MCPAKFSFVNNDNNIYTTIKSYPTSKDRYIVCVNQFRFSYYVEYHRRNKFKMPQVGEKTSV